MNLTAGLAYPLGASLGAQGANIAVWAPDASRVELCLFDARGEVEQQRLDLPACTDGVWHGHLAGSPASLDGQVYGLRVHGAWAPAEGLRFNPNKVLLDPWAEEVVGQYAGDTARYHGHDARHPEQPDGHDNARAAVKGRIVTPLPASQRPGGLTPPIPRAQTVIYELHVKGASMLHPEVPAALRGTYAGLAHPAMLRHFKRLGVTSLCLLPVHARADEARLQALGLTNYWGYSTLSWLAPEPRYAQKPEAVRSEFAAMVGELHAAGLEVLLDVVYNHSGETDARGPLLSLRGLANRHYYRTDPADRSRYIDWSGCGNTLNLAEPRVVELVVGSLRHWVSCYGVDGFRFDLASILGRGADGHFSGSAGFFAAVRSDPVLAGVKLIAEPWDVAPGGYQVGGFPPGWSEWNDQFRDTLRCWWLGSPAPLGNRPHAADRGMLAHRLAASSSQFHHSGRAPTASVNFLTAHDGYTLRDTVSYQQRHNLANGEDNRDGHQSNHSWNCGVEGPSDDGQVEQRRARLQRAMLASLLLAQGTPMLLAGDELGHSQQGNNNAYCQDNPLTWLDWSGPQAAGLIECVARLTALRRQHAALRPERWLTGRADDRGWRDVIWLHPQGHELHGADWADATERALAVRLIAPIQRADGRAGGYADGHAAGGRATGALSDAEAVARDEVALLLLINPQPGPCNFVIPAARWQVVYCSSTPDGASPSGSASLRGGVWPQPGHGLTVLRAPLLSLGPPDVAVPSVATTALAGTTSATAARQSTEDRSDEP
ncbi:MAG: glycogen debranching enzyme GlgX [Pseudomonadota bacterium]|jgi:glycogen operon protein